jgi:hypothetical protein
MELFINENNKPIIPKCGNCKHWSKIDPQQKQNVIGYCRLQKMLFAFTRKSNVYGMTKDFYYCENHSLQNIEKLEKNGYVRFYETIEDAVKEIDVKK